MSIRETFFMIQDAPPNGLDKKWCEAVDCMAPATTEIKVKVGKKGSIHLCLCDGCQVKFKGSKIE